MSAFQKDIVVFVSMTVTLLAITMAVEGCPPVAPPSTVVDASDAFAPPTPTTDGAFDDDSPATSADSAAVVSCASACAAMKTAGCKEGAIADCARVVCQANADPHFKHYNLSCLSKAMTTAAVRACGGECTQ